MKTLFQLRSYVAVGPGPSALSTGLGNNMYLTYLNPMKRPRASAGIKQVIPYCSITQQEVMHRIWHTTSVHALIFQAWQLRLQLHREPSRHICNLSSCPQARWVAPLVGNRTCRQQLQNKQAQQRYRERRKMKVTEMEQALAATSEQLDELQGVMKQKVALQVYSSKSPSWT